jgi:dTDP-4-dehydrorhamnose 3,5-epimerase
MRLLQEPLPGLKLIQLTRHGDDRGYFVENYHESRLSALGIGERFVQDNRSRSQRGVLRGLHAQLQKPQGKFVRVAAGEIFDVAVDARPDSPAYGKWFGCTLRDSEFQALYLPPGFFHGFCVLSPVAEIEYKCTDYYDPKDEIGILWNDPELGIKWPIQSPIMSAKDVGLPIFSRVKVLLEQAKAK